MSLFFSFSQLLDLSLHPGILAVVIVRPTGRRHRMITGVVLKMRNTP